MNYNFLKKKKEEFPNFPWESVLIDWVEIQGENNIFRSQNDRMSISKYSRPYRTSKMRKCIEVNTL